ncbi:MAG: lytic transglycosylase domain-containing protein [Deltaproteobacteria bacterium]|nr:lytic transglycosylase domain-containing protein [Deltaproteobacteria bacterium]
MFDRKSVLACLKRGKSSIALLIAFLFATGLYYGFARYGRAESESTRLAYVQDVFKQERTGLASSEEKALAGYIIAESAAYKIDPLLVLAMIKTESEYYNWSRSDRGALGLMQIMPSTGAELAERLSFKWDGEKTLLNPYTNVKMGMHYYSMLLDLYNDDAHLSLTAYNAGPSSVNARLLAGKDVPSGFARRVMSNYAQYKSALKERVEFY